MNALFELGIKCESAQIDHYELGLRSYHQLLADIGESETTFLAQHFVAELRRTADRLAQRYGRSDETYPDLVVGLYKLARKIKKNPSYCLKVIPPDRASYYHERRANLIRLGIRNVVVIPPEILAQYPQEVFSADFEHRSRSDKARVTARYNRAGRVSERLFDTYGVLLRRQDGKHPSPAEEEQIKGGLDEVFQVFGDLSPLMRKTCLVIIHTGGKKIFRSRRNVYGEFWNSHKTLITGVADASGKPQIRSLAHELIGHFLDHSSVPDNLMLSTIWGNNDHPDRSNLTVSFLDAKYNSEHSVLDWAFEIMNPVSDKKGWTDASLLTPTEVYARLAEQYLSVLLLTQKTRHPVSTQPLEYYDQGRGYWIVDHWKKGLLKEVFTQIEARLELAQKANDLPSQDPPADLLYPTIFQWSRCI